MSSFPSTDWIIILFCIRITPRKFDIVHASEGQKVGSVTPDVGDLTLNRRGTRTSFTFRKVRRSPCNCGKYLGLIIESCVLPVYQAPKHSYLKSCVMNVWYLYGQASPSKLAFPLCSQRTKPTGHHFLLKAVTKLRCSKWMMQFRWMDIFPQVHLLSRRVMCDMIAPNQLHSSQDLFWADLAKPEK